MLPGSLLAEASGRIAAYVRSTPLTYDSQNGIWLKWENRQITGSFKARGALNKILALEPWERSAGLVAASAGNHGQGVALAAQVTDSRALIFAQDSTPENKRSAMRALGADLRLVAGGYPIAEGAAIDYCSRHKCTFVSPYNDAHIVAGQATVASEALGQLEAMRGDGPMPEAWIFPTGGGGLISGCASVLAEHHPRSRLIGVQPAASAFTAHLFKHGDQAGVMDDPTLAEGLSGAIDESSITIPIMRRLVDDIVTVTEDSIRKAIAFAWHTYHQRIEGSAAAALAAALDGTITIRPALVVITGGNIDIATFDRIIGSLP